MVHIRIRLINTNNTTKWKFFTVYGECKFHFSSVYGNRRWQRKIDLRSVIPFIFQTSILVQETPWFIHILYGATPGLNMDMGQNPVPVVHIETT